jgi:Fic family protein
LNYRTPPCPMCLSAKTIKALEEKLRLLKACRPLSPTSIQKIKEQFELEMTYNSNAIEGNSLTLKETFWVVKEGLTIKGKPLKDHLEAKNHSEALDFLYEVIAEGNKNTISEHLIKQLHQLVVKESQSDIAGKYRDGDVYISGADHKPPSFFDVPVLMGDLMNWLRKSQKKHHVIELAALLHHKLANIHPFWDGNGRVSRLVMNILILEAGYPLGVILKNDRKRYYRVLAEADKGDFRPICEFIAQSVLRSLNIYLKMLKPSKSENKKFISLVELASDSTYSATYLRKLATKGKLEAFKEGRNWLSSKEALKNYVNSIDKK